MESKMSKNNVTFSLLSIDIWQDKKKLHLILNATLLLTHYFFQIRPYDNI